MYYILHMCMCTHSLARDGTSSARLSQQTPGRTGSMHNCPGCVELDSPGVCDIVSTSSSCEELVQSP